ncbi:MAG: beta-N-acetylhexosaminidase [Planctomycetota bacterium]
MNSADVKPTDPARIPAPADEAYELTVTPEHVRLAAARPAGLFYGIQTLRQLMPPDAEAREGTPVRSLPCVRVVDHPRYRWRGSLLDCGRHFMPKDFIKRYIDLLAYHKLNVLHWHLTEDQGWRIEIKRFPQLTEIGAWRDITRDSELPTAAVAPAAQPDICDQPAAQITAPAAAGQSAGAAGSDRTVGRGTQEAAPPIPQKLPTTQPGRYGGFYTQDDIREIVAYAASRYITVVPEIELPGHSRAALAAYPELSCTGGSFTVGTEWGVYDDVYCAGNDRTFEFLEGVLTEVLDLFPSEYIHIGGDECPKVRWQVCSNCQARIKAEGLKDEHELQSYVIRRIEKFLSSRGRRLVGWDEILEGGLAPNATVQSWRGMQGALAAATAGHDVISSPTSHCYLDYAQVQTPGEPTRMGFLPLERVYEFEPTPRELTPEQARHVLGLEGNMWTEHAPPARVDWQVFPRLCALAEVAWSPKQARNWPDFSTRLNAHCQRLAALGVRYFIPPAPSTSSATPAAGGAPAAPPGN